jgi:hypothetical protein
MASSRYRRKEYAGTPTIAFRIWKGCTIMQSREQLEKRVAELETQLSAKRGVAMRGVRRRSASKIGNLPLYDIAVGPDLERGEFRGHARGIVAIGDIATGVLALGGLARGVIAVGGLALRLVSFGGLSIGVLAALGGLAIGGLALGGGALGGVALGGGAVGYYACGGGAAGEHVVSATRRDPEAVRFFRERVLQYICGRDRRR